jgi:hypothetical protein
MVQIGGVISIGGATRSFACAEGFAQDDTSATLRSLRMTRGAEAVGVMRSMPVDETAEGRLVASQDSLDDGPVVIHGSCLLVARRTKKVAALFARRNFLVAFGFVVIEAGWQFRFGADRLPAFEPR